MLKKVVLGLVVVTLLGWGYLTIDNWIKYSDISMWSFVPDNAALVLEFPQPSKTYTHLSEQQIWKTLVNIPSIKRIDEGISRVDSVLNEKGRLLSFLDETPFLISVHNTGQSSFDFLYIAQIQNIQGHDLLNRVQQAFSGELYTKNTRQFLDFDITEISDKNGNTFTYIFFKNYLIGSFTAILVEDAIRTQTDSDMLSFQKQFPAMATLTKLGMDQGNAYVNQRLLGDLIGGFAPNSINRDFSQSAFYDLAVSGSTVELNGFTFVEENDFLAKFSGITGGAFDLAEVVSNETSVFHHFSDAGQAGMLKKLGEGDSSSAIKQKMMAELDFDVNQVYQLMDQEIGLAINYADRVSKVLFLEVKDAGETIAYFEGIARRYANAKNDTVFSEDYMEFKIIEIPTTDLATALIGPMGNGFEGSYLTSYRNYIILASGLPALKNQVDDILAENTWKKSLRKTRFLERTSQSACYSLYINTPASWSSFVSQFTTPIGSEIRRYDYLLKSLENIAIQYNAVDDKFFTHLLIDQPAGVAVMGESSVKVVESLTFGAPISSKPHLVKSHVSSDFEIILQDSANRIYMVGDDFKVLWNVQAEEQIIGKIEALDYYKNNKYQYAFITSSKIHLIDHNGEYLPGYPAAIKGAGAFKSFQLIDYQNTKDYRLGLVDDNGDLYITDKNGDPLEDWKGINLGHAPVTPLRHFRIGGTDVFCVVLANGELHMLSRRALEYPGFPIKTNQAVVGEYHVEQGNNFASTNWTLITQTGELITVNLKGETRARLQFYKPDNEVTYSILRDVSGRNFLIVRRSANIISILDAQDRLLFEKDYISKGSVFMQYYHLSSSRKYIVLGDETDQFVYIYDLNGRLITSQPIQGNQPVTMLYSEKKDQLRVYVANGNELQVSVME